jgi:hypothetical protein
LRSTGHEQAVRRLRRDSDVNRGMAREDPFSSSKRALISGCTAAARTIARMMKGSGVSFTRLPACSVFRCSRSSSSAVTSISSM